MSLLSSPAVRRALRLTGYILLTLLVYWINAVTPPAARLGILYIIPVLLVTWTEGLAWGIVFALVTTGLREAIAWVWPWRDSRPCDGGKRRWRGWSFRIRSPTS